MEKRARSRRSVQRNSKKKALTSDVLPPADAVAGPPGKWRLQYKTLLALRDKILRSQNGLFEGAKEEQPVFSLHEADAATDQYDLDFALSMVSAEQDAIYEIEQAINRIQQGTYGICELTGRRIDPERLKVIPWTRFSADAQRKLEQGGLTDRVKFKARQSLTGPEITREPEEENTPPES